jgi:hypothetical protein
MYLFIYSFIYSFIHLFNYSIRNPDSIVLNNLFSAVESNPHPHEHFSNIKHLKPSGNFMYHLL